MTNKIFEREYRRLNLKQHEAVDAIEGPVMVIAGPGTGKTQILAMRIANILKLTQVNPSNILALTFTNSGVYQMKKRLLEIIGLESYNVHVHTFHSFCNEVINSYPERFAITKEINQLTDLEQILLVHDILDKSDLNYLKRLKAPYLYDKTIIQTIGELKQEGISPQEFQKIIKDELKKWEKIPDLYHEKGVNKGKVKAKYQEQKEQLYKNQELGYLYEKYQEELATTGKYDYADMILLVIKAFREDLEILSIYQEKFQYILVDEYQDTNSAQNEIIKILGSFYDKPNIFVVGDDEQSIFRFQGASLENILFFSNNYPDTKIIVLEHNYRSTQRILDSSRAVIENNKNQIFNLLKIQKKLVSQNKMPGRIVIGEFAQGSTENYFVAKEIQKLLKSHQKLSEIAVIYKEHRDVEELVDFLSKMNIPYQIEIGGNVLDDPEIIKIINILTLLDDLNDDQLIFEIMHYPFWGIPMLDLYKLTNLASSKRQHIFETMITLAKKNLQKPEKNKKFIELLLKIKSYFQNKTFAEAFELCINETGYLKYLLKLSESIHHLNRLQSLFGEIKLLNIKNKKFNLTDFKNYLCALEENNLTIKERPIDANFEGIRLMTAHKSKGLEFETVFIIHCTDNHWGNAVRRRLIKLPGGLIHFQDIDDENDEEERRLFYVALTRTKHNAYITYANGYGEKENISLTVRSKFISELPKKHLEQIDTKKYEKNYEEKLKLKFSKKKWFRAKTLNDFIESLLENFQLSVTSFNAYLECPYAFFLNQLIRVPKVKNFNQSYGTAVHSALELFFKKFSKDLKLPEKDELIRYFTENLELEIMTESKRKRAEKWGIENLQKYYDFYQEEWLKNGPPLSCEYSFYYHKVRFENIPITGKVDKIELLDRISNTVRIVDYKTSSPKSLNELMGLTKKKNLDELHQAYFYKLLAEQDPLFGWNVGEISFDFLTPEKDKFKRVNIQIEAQKYLEFKELVKDTYKNIRKKDFALDLKSCKKYNFACEYYNLCQTHKKH